MGAERVRFAPKSGIERIRTGFHSVLDLVGDHAQLPFVAIGRPSDGGWPNSVD